VKEATGMKPGELMIQPGLRWYAIQTKGNKEKEVAKRLTDLKFEIGGALVASIIGFWCRCFRVIYFAVWT
jgi:hypothetical protein